ncbi:SRPBCC family protein [Sphingomonas pruni]|uniref:SRPBCC family protein n=1 Tax=Sphingomonas pruni TaxID=40683 RepID=UPI00082AF3A8|nr:SRPBCC family protein [Sphingomonas pruni]
MSARQIELTGERFIDAAPADIFAMLIEPAHQLAWNSLYLSASLSPAGPVAEGSVMTGRFKGAGRATVTFANVVPGSSFTHVSRLLAGGFLPLGDFRHRYDVAPVGNGALVRQTVRVDLNWVGRLLRGTISSGFRRRLPESFDEFYRYATSPHRGE